MKKRMLSLLLAALLLLPAGLPALASEEPEEPAPDRLTISILGDSNSAYTGWSEGAAADTTNSTIRNNSAWYEESDMPVESMWWYLAARELGAEILVNNSWTGSCVLAENEPYAGAGTEGWRDRCVNLHDDTGENAGEEPDIIAIFLGTCDCTFHYETIGSAAEVDHDALICETEGGVVYRAPKTSAEAYAVMLDRIARRYPHAEIYCMTVLPRRDADFWRIWFIGRMNDIIRAEAARVGAVVVDIHDDAGITSNVENFDRYMLDRLHPNEAGMARIADVFVRAVRSNAFSPEDAETILRQSLPLS